MSAEPTPCPAYAPSHVHCIPYEDYQRLMTMFNQLRAENRKLATELQRAQKEAD